MSRGFLACKVKSAATFWSPDLNSERAIMADVLGYIHVEFAKISGNVSARGGNKHAQLDSGTVGLSPESHSVLRYQ
jgi:hypothetical protein